MNLIIETIGSCNLKCTMCPTINYDENKFIMDDKVFNKTLDYLKYEKVDYIGLEGWGEPLLDKKLADRIKLIKSISPDTKVAFTSNATLFNSKRIDEILLSGVDHINISFDAAFKTTYEKIRVNSDYDKVMNNLTELSIKRRNFNTKLSVAFVVMKSNYKEIYNFIKIFSEMNFDVITFKPLDVVSSKENLSDIVDRNEIIKTIAEIKEKHSITIDINFWNIYPNNLTHDCLANTVSSIFINCNGDVSPCCNLGHHVPAIKKSFLMNSVVNDNFFSFGNLKTAELNTILESTQYKNFINLFKSNKIPKECEGCNLVGDSLRKKVVLK